MDERSENRYFKKGRSVYMIAHVETWGCTSETLYRVVSDSEHAPYRVAAGRYEPNLEPATVEEWNEMLAVAEKHQRALNKAARLRADAETFGVRVKRTIRGWRESQPGPDDFIVRATKSQWIGVLARYRRTGSEYQIGYTTKRGGFGSREAQIDVESLAELERLAGGRERVDFVKERKAAGQ